MCRAATATLDAMATDATPISLAAAVAREPERALLTRTAPFATCALEGTPLAGVPITTVELPAGGELYGLVTAHLAKQASTSSFSFDVGKRTRRGTCCDSDDSDEEGDSEVTRAAVPDLGLGLFTFSFEDKPVHALHQTMGEVVGTQCGAALMKNLVLIAPGANEVSRLTKFCDELISAADSTTSSKFTVYRFHVSHHYWRRCEVVEARPIQSVVLPAALKAKVVDDLADFVCPSTRKWYLEHGIPYKRAYLLHGAPGAGKTSLIQALAGRFKRNVCYLGCLTHPDMNDDALKEAMNRVPHKSIIVLEDVDALFSGRVKKHGDKSALTFSGVLNALDGVGGCSGQIFVMTTNHRELLDPALIRNGRVDLHVEFTDATREQMKGLFIQFYKAATTTQADEFADALSAVLGEKTVSCAALQHFFILQRKATIEEAIANVGTVLEEAAAHGQALEAKKTSAAAKDEAAEKEKEEDQEQDPKAKGTKSLKGKAGSPAVATGAGGKEVHVHLHVD